MTGRHSGVVARVRVVSPSVQAMYCFIHSEASNHLSPELKEILNVVKMVNFIKAHATKSRIFTALCEEMVLHTDVRWLSRVKVISRVYWGHEIQVFLTQRKSDLALHLQYDEWIAKLAYLSDILVQFNHLNLSMQGRASYIFQANDTIAAFKKKLGIWRDRVDRGISICWPCSQLWLMRVVWTWFTMRKLMGSHRSQTLLKLLPLTIWPTPGKAVDA